jgi:hypothetical protein
LPRAPSPAVGIGRDRDTPYRLCRSRVKLARLPSCRATIPYELSVTTGKHGQRLNYT